MDAIEFDRLARAVSTQLPRRTLAGLLGLSSLSAASLAEARKDKKKKKVKRNDFGCVSVGKFCKKDGHCCSGTCQGKKDKKKCKAHDETTCLPGLEGCQGVGVSCTTTAGILGRCASTTGQAPYCFADADCFPCSRDSECEPTFGTGAACIVCSECTLLNPQGTACAGTNAQL